MDFEFAAEPASLLLRKGRTLIVGDLHLGKELSMEREGIHFHGAAKALSSSILAAYKRTRAKRIVFLGDIKDSITYPDFDEYKSLREFFAPLRGIELHVAKGNHDSHLQDVFRQIGVQANVENEIIIGRAAFIHGTSMPSEQAMQRPYLFAAHIHALVRSNGSVERAWIVSNVGAGARKLYKKYNKDMQLFVAPAANNLIAGKIIYSGMGESFMLFRKRVFNFKSSKVYSISGKLLGTAGKVASAD